MSSLDRDGFAIVPNVIDAATAAALILALDDEHGANSQRGGAVFARRNLLDNEAIRRLAASPEIRDLIEPILGPNTFAARGLLFDKTPGANWNLLWHQDLTIAVQARLETDGFGPWSEKAGVTHVQPPTDILERMLAVRIHLDDCGFDNGPLRVLPSSHLAGRLTPDAIAEWREHVPETICAAERGGVLLMRPLLLHASSASRVPGHRRVVHLEFAADDLPNGLRWHERMARRATDDRGMKTTGG